MKASVDCTICTYEDKLNFIFDWENVSENCTTSTQYFSVPGSASNVLSMNELNGKIEVFIAQKQLSIVESSTNCSDKVCVETSCPYTVPYGLTMNPEASLCSCGIADACISSCDGAYYVKCQSCTGGNSGSDNNSSGSSGNGSNGGTCSKDKIAWGTITSSFECTCSDSTSTCYSKILNKTDECIDSNGNIIRRDYYTLVASRYSGTDTKYATKAECEKNTGCPSSFTPNQDDNDTAGLQCSVCVN